MLRRPIRAAKPAKQVNDGVYRDDATLYRGGDHDWHFQRPSPAGYGRKV
jgi:hypothetical protein